MRAVLREADRARLRAHAEAGYPDEVCGFLLGSMEASARSFDVREIRPAMNRRASRASRRYRIDPAEYRAAEREAEEKGLELVGIYHSHPDAPAVPSRYDREHAWPNSAYVIVPVRAGRAWEPRAWLLAEDRSGFDELGTFEGKGG
ncbi:MAG: M67 family metallopeptidase [Gemmatimonadota bacterium]